MNDLQQQYKKETGEGITEYGCEYSVGIYTSEYVEWLENKIETQQKTISTLIKRFNIPEYS